MPSCGADDDKEEYERAPVELQGVVTNEEGQGNDAGGRCRWITGVMATNQPPEDTTGSSAAFNEEVHA
jgi:hypothetical protein